MIKILLAFCIITALIPISSLGQNSRTVVSKEITGTLLRYENFPSKLVQSRRIDVWLPVGFSKAKKYPVVYMHDGQNLFDPQEAVGGVDWGVDETLQNLINEKKIKETIVVAIWQTPKRLIEYSPQKAFDAVNRKGVKKSPFITKKEGLSDKYLKFIVTELKPFIDKKFPTLSDRENTFVMGSSMGGLISLYAISEFPNTFGGAASLSTQFPLGDGVMIEYMKKNLPPPKTHKIYFDYGTETLDAELEQYQKSADSLMKKKGYKQGKNWLTKKFPGEEHSEKSWRKRVNIPFEFLLGR